MKVYKLTVAVGNEKFKMYFKSRQKAEEEVACLEQYYAKQNVVTKSEIEFFSNDLVPWRPRREQNVGREDSKIHIGKRLPNAWRNKDKDALK